MGMIGESSRLSLMTTGSFTHAALGVESATGVGNPEFELCQKTLSGLTALDATQSAGSAGGVTLSKFSPNGTHGPKRRTVAIASPTRAPAIQRTACTNPLAGLVKLKTPFPEPLVAAVP
jgi:hypothetical protein